MKYTIRAAAIATGISESRLRTWERRYGIPSPGRSSTGRRLYDEDDLTIIRRMAALVAAGIAPNEAAEAARSEEGLALPLAEEEGAPPDHPLVAELHEASLKYDEARTIAAIREAVARLGWDSALDDVVFPALRRIGQFWGENVLESANEHFTSEIVRREIATAIAALAPGKAPEGGVLLACPEDERHELGVLGLSLLLRDRGARVVFLGADVPVPDLLLAIQQTGVAAVCLAATTRNGLASLGRTARIIVSARVPVRLFVGGPAVNEEGAGGTITGTVLPQSVAAAADVIAESLRPGGRGRRG